jgi:hypothetical protein
MATQIKNSAAGIVNESYVSTGTLLLSDNLMWGKTFLRQDERDFLTFLESNQSWAVSDGSTIRWHEKSWLTNNAKVGAINSGGASAGASMVIQIAAADHYVSGTRSPFIANTTLRIGAYDLFIQSKSEAVANAHTITVIAPVGSTAAAVALNSVISVGQTMVPTGNAYAENTDYGTGTTELPTEFEESLAIVKDSLLVTGTQGTNKMKVVGAYGGTNYVTHDSDVETFIRHKINLSFQMLIGPGGTTVDSAGNTVRLMRGVEGQIKARGTTYPYNASLSIGDVYNWTRILLNERAPMENLMKVGHEANINLEGVMTEAMKQGAKIYMDNTKPGLDSKLIDFGFDAVQVAGFVFYKTPFVEFNHPMITGAAGQTYPHKIMITPHKMVKDAKTGQSGYTMKIGYKSANGPKGIVFDRKFQFSLLGNSAPVPTNGMDNVTFNYLTECGPAIACANQAMIVERSDI